MISTFPPIPPVPPNPQRPPRRRLRRGLVIGAVVVGLAGVGGAAVWAADASTTPSPSPSASAQPSTHTGKPGAGKVGAQTLHGEMTVKKADGTVETLFVQRGTVTDVSSTSVTVRSDDGFTRSYTLNRSTTFAGQGAAKGSAAIKDGDVAKGDTIVVRAVQSGPDYVAQQVKKGPFSSRGNAQGPRQRGQGAHKQQSAPSSAKPTPAPSDSPHS